MNAQPGSSWYMTPAVGRSPWSNLIRCSVATAATLLAAVGVLLVIRRCSGGLTQPIPTLQLLVVALVLSGLAAAWRCYCFSADSQFVPDRQLANWLRNAAPGIVLLLFACSLSLPGSSGLGLLFFWSILVGEELVAHWFWHAPRVGATSPRELARRELTEDPVQRIPTTAMRPSEFTLERDESTQPESDSLAVDVAGLPDGVWQQITQAHDDDGQQVFYGRLRGEFAVGQRSTSLHVAFCPPLESVPQIFAEQIEGPEVTIKPAQVLPYGVRFDVKRNSLGEGCETVIIEFYAS